MGDVLDRTRLLFCCVDTPPTYSGDADLSRVEAVVDELGDSDEHAIVMKSTVPVGTGRSIQRKREGLGYVSNPEFLKEGSAVKDFMHPDRVVVGADEHSEAFADRVAALYEPLGGPIVRTDVASAEMVKLASNAFLATKISFINEIANVSEELGADVSEVARGMGLDDRIGPKFLQAGLGFGGSCFPKDVSALKQLAGNSGYDFQLLTSVIEVNDLQKRRAVGKLQKHLGSLVGKEIALLGVAFKPDTDDIREATSLVLAARLQGEGANVRVYDPVAAEGAREMLGGAAICDSAARRARRRRRRGARDRVARVRRARLGGRGEAADGAADRGRRPQLPRPRGAARGRLHLRGHRPLAVQALVLAGGEGTRLRPLTLTTPKPVMPLAGRPFLTFMLDWLGSHGVDEVILSCGFLSDGVRDVLGDIYGGMRLRYVVEEEPLGTAGPGAPGARRGPAGGAPVRAQRRRAQRHGPHRAARPARGDGRAGHPRADRGGGHRLATAWCPPTRTAGWRRSSRSPTGRRPRTASTRARTCSSARWWRRSSRAARCRSSARCFPGW